MPAPQTYNLQSVVEDDTWAGFSVGSITVGGGNPANTAASATLEFRKVGQNVDQVALTLTSGAGDINITNTTTYATTVNERTPLGLDPGKYKWRLRYTDTGSPAATKTYVWGTIEVLPK